jgi:hypothetical protein
MRAALRAALARTTPADAMVAAIDLTPPPQPVSPPDTLEVIEGAGLGASARRRRVAGAILGFVAIGVVAGAFAARSLLGTAHAPAQPQAAAAASPSPSPSPPAVSPPPVRPAAAASAALRPVGSGEPASPPASPAKAATPERPSHTRPPRDRGLVRAADVRPRHPRQGDPAAVPSPSPAIGVAAPPPPTPAVAPPQRPPQPPALRIDVEHATASITGVTTTSAIPGSNVRAALGRVPLARCYRDALRAGGMTSGAATLHLRIDGAGYVTGATLQGTGVTPALKACLEKAATALRIKDVDTGDATADVALSFVAAP